MIARIASLSLPGRVRIDRAVGADRSSAALVLALGVAWLAYTRLYSAALGDGVAALTHRYGGAAWGGFMWRRCEL